MSDRFTATTRLRVSTPQRALDLVAAVAAWPLRDETVAVALDARRSTLGVAVIAPTHDHDAVLTVAEFLAAEIARPSPAQVLIVATMRPRRPPDPADACRWTTVDTMIRRAGGELLEWFVVGDRVHLPRQSAGDRSRW